MRAAGLALLALSHAQDDFLRAADPCRPNNCTGAQICIRVKCDAGLCPQCTMTTFSDNPSDDLPGFGPVKPPSSSAPEYLTTSYVPPTASTLSQLTSRTPAQGPLDPVLAQLQSRPGSTPDPTLVSRPSSPPDPSLTQLVSRPSSPVQAQPSGSNDMQYMSQLVTRPGSPTAQFPDPSMPATGQARDPFDSQLTSRAPANPPMPGLSFTACLLSPLTRFPSPCSLRPVHST